ncbi:aldose 1-epimerase family protein [Halobacteriovorax sp. GB3]|uniref:aldose 1-epimerase family protein n=1 Tax=Halobacteriovorax sp. GB3 TaxID=2719615 RepID=UPI0023629D3D|nr:aldose 1-epimerase family protein [Halobacteriovorax sp. GB3]MDD0852480.1 aldose 1-epimerase family protein [Halobacteriovorax sp. GB3]
MDEIKISSHFVTARISSFGAELKGLKDRESNIEYIWQGDSDHWERSAPILFPIVGSLREDKYRIGRKYYGMSRHGFARDSEFEIIEKEKDSVKLRLIQSDETLKIFPFKFSLDVRYKVYGPKLIISYEVKNLDRKEMFFSIGSHPAFNVPLNKGQLEDYFVEFEKREEKGAYYLHNGLVDFHSPDDKTMMIDDKRIELTKDLFKSDALIFKDPDSKRVFLKNSFDEHSVTIDFGDIPYLGLWAPEGAPFVCIEPWYGVADATDSNNDFVIKEGLISLEQEKSFKCEYTIHVN